MVNGTGSAGRRRVALWRHFRRGRWRVPIGPLLVLSSGGVVLVAVMAVLSLGFWGISNTIVDLGREKAGLVATIVEAQLAEGFDHVRDQTALVADIAQKRGIDPLQDDGFVDLLAGALAGTPGLTALDYFSADGDWLRVTLNSETGVTVRRRTIGDPAAAAALARSVAEEEPSWGAIFWDDSLQQPLLNFRLPTTGPAGQRGLLVAVISMADLSLAFDQLNERYGVVPFILLERQYVLAHPNLARGFAGRAAMRPLPRLDEVGDPILAAIWQQGSLVDRLRSNRVYGGTGHLRQVDGTTYVYLYREVPRPGTEPWLVGSILREDSVDAALDRSVNVVLASVAILLLAVLAAAVASRRLSRRFHDFAALAGLIRSLDFEAAPTLRRSRVREVDDTAQAMNQMSDAMRWFVTYVPRGLVSRLIRMGHTDRLVSENRVLTVMFTDITGFTALSEAMRAEQVAAYLNRHFSLLEDCVEAHDGTVDKMLGDGLMAFWGAPDDVPDHARRACSAALAMAAAIAKDNRALQAEGLPTIQLRIGLHTGPVTVGNIGGTTRVNYTIVGDTVNTAQRISEHVRELKDRGEATILVSDDTRQAAVPEAGFDFSPEGEVRLRGQVHVTRIFRLAGRPLPAASDGQSPAGRAAGPAGGEG